MSCGKTLTWKELIPVFSFLIQRGSCKKCKSKISWQYPIVEIATGAVFILLLLFFPPTTYSLAFKTVLYAIITAVLMVICIYDIRHKIIPDNLAFLFAGLSILSLFVGGDTWFHIPSMWALLAGPILALPFVLIWLVSKGTWMGLGDGKLVLGIGWLLGINSGVNALVLAFWIAAFVSVVYLLIRYRKLRSRVEIPFGPYLILGMYIVLFTNIRVLDINMLVQLIRVIFRV